MKKITLIFLMMFSSFVGFSQLFEDFEGTSLPNATGDWSLATTAGQSLGSWKVLDNGIGLAQSWGVNTIPLNVYAGARSAYINRENVVDGSLAEDRLVTPSVNVPNNGQLRFWTKQTLAGIQGSTYSVEISSTSQTTGFTTLQTWTEADMNVVYNVYEEKVVPIPAAYFNTSVYIAFVMTNDNGDRWLIDNVNLIEQCLDPTTQTVTGETLNSAVLGWDNPSGATQWEVEIVAAGTAATGSGTTVATSTYPALGLTQGTCYDFYVRALCASGASSEWIGPFNFCTVSLGETCGAPIQVLSLPYVSTDNTSGYGDDYSGSPGSSGCGTTGTYLNGDDVFYSFTATSTNSVTISSLTNSTWSGLFVYNSCANVGTSCVAGSTAGNGTTTPDSVTFTPVLGETYYIVISTWATPQSVPYTFSIIENTCTNMAATFALVSNCTSTTDPNTFFVNATVTNMGSATSIAGTSTPASPTTVPAITAAGVMQFGPFPNGTPVTVSLQNEQDANCFKNSVSLTQTLCPATNNLCSGAIPVTCGSTFTQTTVGATTAGAPVGTCGTTAGSGGLWYSYMGNGDIVTFSLCGSSFDTKIQVVTGGCGAFTCVTGNDDSCGVQSQVQVTTAVGTLYYVYVYGFGTAQGVFTLNTTCITPPPPPVNDNCATATTVPVNTDGSCTQITPGTVVGGTPSTQANACTGTADDDVWFSFTATQTTHTISLQNVTGSNLDLNHVVYTSTNAANPCGNLTQVLCSNPDFSLVTGLVAGQVYYIRIYTATATPLQTTTFDVCVSVPPPPPSNDSCATPIVAPVNSSIVCTATTPGTITSATASPEPNACTGTADDDVWFQFTALANIQNINLNNIQGTTTDLAFAVYSGVSCGSLTQINCQVNNNGVVGGLTVGDVYYIRVYSQPATPNLLANFDLCITTPVQCNSAQTFCGDNQEYVNQTGLASYGNIGCLSTTPNPFWFQFTVEVSGPITFTLQQTTQPNGGGTGIDVDFIIWGPFTDAEINGSACNSLYDYPDGNTTIPNNVIDCSYSASSIESIDIPNAQVGQNYLLLVTNYGNSSGYFSLPQTSGTGSASCCNVVLGNDITLCDEASYDIVATTTNDDSIKWFKDNVLLPGEILPTLTVTQTGTYKCEITCGQLTKTDEIVVTFNTSTTPTFDPIPTNICINGTAPMLPITSLNGVTGTWSPSTIDTSVATTTPTEYVFTPTAGLCASSLSIFVSIDALTPSVFAGLPTNICQNVAPPSLSLTDDNGVLGTWNPATIDTSILGAFTSTFTPDAGQCAESYILNIVIDAPSIVPTFSFNLNYCEGSTPITLPTTSDNGIIGVWNSTSIDMNTLGLTTYTFTSNGNQCSQPSVSYNVTITSTPQAQTITDIEVCKGSSYMLPTLNPGNSYYTSSGGVGPINASNPLIINATEVIYVYANSGTPPNNCTDEKNFTITAVDKPVISLEGGCVNNVFTITATVATGENVQYQWSNASGVIVGATGSSIIVNQDGIYSCKVSLSSGAQCESEMVSLLANGTLCQIQKGISPNGDGLNENFDLTGLNVKKLEIYNRYGKKVYSFANYTDQWFGQSDKGEELPVGTYYFVIERDNVESETGWIYINR